WVFAARPLAVLAAGRYGRRRCDGRRCGRSGGGPGDGRVRRAHGLLGLLTRQRVRRLGRSPRGDRGRTSGRRRRDRCRRARWGGAAGGRAAGGRAGAVALVAVPAEAATVPATGTGSAPGAVPVERAVPVGRAEPGAPGVRRAPVGSAAVAVRPAGVAGAAPGV